MNMTRFMTAAAVAALLAGPAVAQSTTQPTTGQTGTTTDATDTNTTTPVAPEDQDAQASSTVNAGTTGQNLGSTTAQGTFSGSASTGGAMTSGNVQVVANAPIPDTPENRARYGQPESNAGKRTIGEGPVGQLSRAPG